MPHVEKPPEDFRRVLREKALSHSLFYLKLGAGANVSSVPQRRRSVSRAAPAQPATRARRAQPRVSELLLHFEPGMHYLRPPRAASPDDISSSDDDDRAAVRRRDLSDDSAVEVEPRRRQSRASPPPDMSPRRERTLVEAHVVGGRGRTVRTPSVVVSDWSDGVVGASAEEVGWLRARALSADSACSSCSTLSSRDDDDFEPPAQPKKIVNAE